MELGMVIRIRLGTTSQTANGHHPPNCPPCPIRAAIRSLHRRYHPPLLQTTMPAFDPTTHPHRRGMTDWHSPSASQLIPTPSQLILSPASTSSFLPTVQSAHGSVRLSLHSRPTCPSSTPSVTSVLGTPAPGASPTPTTTIQWSSRTITPLFYPLQAPLPPLLLVRSLPLSP